MALTVSYEAVVCRARCLLGFLGCSKRVRKAHPAWGWPVILMALVFVETNSFSPTGWGEIFRGNHIFALRRAGSATADVVACSLSRGNN